MQKERSGAEKFIKSMLKKYPWIESEKEAFGVEGGDYDFNVTDPAQMSSQLKSLKHEQETLGRKINKKVMGMIEKAEGEYTELLRKRKVVENDKKKIQAVIEELDVKKKSELGKCALSAFIRFLAFPFPPPISHINIYLLIFLVQSEHGSRSTETLVPSSQLFSREHPPSLNLQRAWRLGRALK